MANFTFTVEREGYHYRVRPVVDLHRFRVGYAGLTVEVWAIDFETAARVAALRVETMARRYPGGSPFVRTDVP